MYEITFITKDEKNETVKNVLDEIKAKILKTEELGRKKFTFPIMKEEAGFYHSIVFEIEPGKISELEKKLKLKTDILRHLTITRKHLEYKIQKEKIEEKVKIEEPKLTVKDKIEKPIEKETESKIKEEKTETKKSQKPVKEKAIEKKKEIKEKVKIEKPAKKDVKKPVEAPKKEEREKLDEEDRLKALEEKLEEILKD